MSTSPLTIVVRPRGKLNASRIPDPYALYPFPRVPNDPKLTPPGRPIKNLPESINVSADASASQIFEEIAKASRFSIHRLRVTKGSDGSPIPNTKDVTVHDTGLRNKSAVDVKDLGT